MHSGLSLKITMILTMYGGGSHVSKVVFGVNTKPKLMMKIQFYFNVTKLMLDYCMSKKSCPIYFYSC